MIFTSYFDIGGSSLKTKDVVAMAKEMGKETLMISDPNFYGFPEFYQECHKAEIKPIFSISTTVDGLDVVIVMKNEAGYKYLIEKVSTKLNIENLNNENLFVIIKGFKTKENLEENIEKLPNAYIGIYSYKNLERYAKARILYSLKGSRKVVSLYIPTHKDEIDYRSTMIMKGIKEEKKFHQVNELEDNFYVKNEADANEEWVKNFKEIEDSCIDDYKFDNPIPPKYNFTKEDAVANGLPETTTDSELFAFLSRKGLDKRLKRISEDKHQLYKDRLEVEISIINQMGFPGYMLIVADFVQAAKNMDIPVGPGRGSAAGSLVAYALEITNIDPIPYNLLFERFLNPERVSMPDIDMDFCQTNRQKVIRYVEDRYGKEKVAQIITYGKLVAKGIIRDVARVMGYPLLRADKLAKIIPEDPGTTLDKAYELKKEELDREFEDSWTKKIWDDSKKLEGLIRNEGVHAAGLIISDEPVYKKAPTTEVNGATVIQYEGKYTEFVDLIKFDFLGLKTLSVIKAALDMIKRNHGVDIDIDYIDMNDKEVYDFISTGKTEGIFQIESTGMQDLAKRMKPSNFEDIIAMLALYRPGPMESGMLDDFVDRKNGAKKVEYFFDDFEEKLKPILEPTYGVIVYQEQVMQIVQEIGGFTLGEADIIRRAMGKKNVEYMNQKAEEFANGAEKQGLDRGHAVTLFDLIIKFAGYGFNKSHSAAYAMITFQTAFLKRYYPAEFFAALMNFDKDVEKVARYIHDARHLGLTVLPPNVNTSTEEFNTKDGKTIIYSISNIKRVGSGAAKIVKEREENGEFDSFEDFNKRLPKTNKRVITGLVNSGAFDSIEVNRKRILEPNAEDDFSLSEKLTSEFNTVGEYITDPFKDVKGYTEPYKIPELTDLEDGLNYILIYPQSIKYIIPKKSGKKLGFFSVYYNHEIKEIMIYNSKLEEINDMNMNRPWILKIKKGLYNGSESLTLENKLVFSMKNLEQYFMKK